VPNNVKQGFEGQILTGTVGSTATSLLENVKDINYNVEITKGNTTVRGDSTAPPVKTEDPTQRICSIEFQMINDITDTLFEQLMTAACAGTAVAIRTRWAATGKGFDGDCTLSHQHSQTLEGEQAITFTATPSRSYGRAPNPYI